ncbi:MAG: DUF2782 domain-containing protein [Gammaproteobacteria bacterium]|nr:DUF2782 domain-containing protein [Gammaproteobacteria bacterium]
MLAGLTVAALLGHGAGSAEELDLLDAPPPPPPVESGQVLEPDVNIIRTEDGVIEEYRANGGLYMVRIKPAVGPAYYLVDQDGDGVFEREMSIMKKNFEVPHWVLFSWD